MRFTITNMSYIHPHPTVEIRISIYIVMSYNIIKKNISYCYSTTTIKTLHNIEKKN